MYIAYPEWKRRVDTIDTYDFTKTELDLLQRILPYPRNSHRCTNNQTEELYPAYHHYYCDNQCNYRIGRSSISFLNTLYDNIIHIVFMIFNIIKL